MENKLGLVKRDCEHCGNSYQPISSGSKFCGIECRVYKRVEILENGCHLYKSGNGFSGFVVVSIDGKNVAVHRWSYEHYIEPIPEGYKVLHHCKNNNCVNREHLYLHLNKGTVRDGSIKKCKNNLHDMTPDNIKILYYRDTTEVKERKCISCYEATLSRKTLETYSKAKKEKDACLSMNSILKKGWMVSKQS